MGLLQRIFGREAPAAEQRFYVDPYWANWFALNGSPGSVPASPDIVLSNLSVAARCVALRSELLASVPLHLYRRTPSGGRERADDNPLYRVLHDSPNSNQSAYEFRELMVRSLDYWGNAYARIIWNARGAVTGLVAILYGDCTVDQLPNGRLRYRVFNQQSRRTETLLAEEVLHIRGPTRDGIIGWSPIMIARASLGLAVAQATTAQSLSENGLRPSGLLSYPQMLSPDQRQSLHGLAKDEHAGARNAGKLMIVDGGGKFEKMSFSPEDSQFLEQRRLSNEDVARVFGVPPTSVGILDKGTYSNTEQESYSLVQNCIGPLAARIETAMQRCLLTDVGRRNLYIEHDLDGLLRGDVKSRYDAYRVGRESGILSVNDVRRAENEPPIGAEGDLHHMPANWIQLGPGSVVQPNNPT
jgi:HK97 family phage portal protein